MISQAVPLLAQVTSKAVDCPPAPKDLGAFHDAINLVLHERESVSGGVCIGGLKEFGSLAISHMEVSLVAIGLAVLVAIPLGLWLGPLRPLPVLPASVSDRGPAVPPPPPPALLLALLRL